MIREHLTHRSADAHDLVMSVFGIPLHGCLAQIEGAMKAIATGLLSVFACMGVPPIIKYGLLRALSVLRNRDAQGLLSRRCQSDGPARMVAQILDGMLRDYLGSGAGSVFAGTPAVASQPRPLCVLLDRSLDLSVPLRHSSSYQVPCDCARCISCCVTFSCPSTYVAVAGASG
jgi:hypothetical protein